MKVEETNVSVTGKSLSSDLYPGGREQNGARDARPRAHAPLPGFRPGKVPPRSSGTFTPQIRHEVAHGLIPRAVEDALRERGVEPVDTPDVKDVSIYEGRPLTFTAAIETAPPMDPGPLESYPAAAITGVGRGLGRRSHDRPPAQRAGPIRAGRRPRGGSRDTLVTDMTRQKLPAEGGDTPTPESLTAVGVELGAEANPPGFDAEVLGLKVGDQKTFRVSFPADYPVEDMAGAEVEYALTVTALRRKVLPDLDVEFAKGGRPRLGRGTGGRSCTSGSCARPGARRSGRCARTCCGSSPGG